MHTGLDWQPVAIHQFFQSAADARVNRADADATSNKREKCRPVTRLGRDSQVVFPAKPCRQRQTLQRRRLRRHSDDTVDIGIAAQNASGVGEHQGVNRGLGPRLPQAANQWRSQQHVSEPAQCNDQNARPQRKIDPLHAEGPSPPAFAFCDRRLSAMPPATPTPKT